MFPSSGILDIIIIVYYVPALLIAVYAGLKHGFAKTSGWLQLILLALFRLTGSSLGIAGIYKPSIGVITASIIFANMGTITLVGSLFGLIRRANGTLGDRAFAPRLGRLIGLATIAAIVLAAIGGSEVAQGDDSGRALYKAAILIIAVLYVIAAVICFQTLALRSSVPQAEHRLLYVCLMSLPFILVRVVYAICGVFDYQNSDLSILSSSTTAIVLRAILGVLMEFIVVGLFLWAGCTVDRSAEREAERAAKYQANGIYQSRDGDVHHSAVKPKTIEV